MKRIMVTLKKTMVVALAFIMAASLAVPAPAMAAATKDETQAGSQTETAEQADAVEQADAAGTTAAAGQTDAAEPIMAEIKITNYTAGRTGAETVSGLVISDIEAPEAGKALDQKAQVTTAENEKWEVPVLWISSKKQIAMGSAEKGVTYLPVVAYVVPPQYKIRNADGSENTYTVTLSEEVTKLFGDTKIITLYEQTTGITYILPESVKKYLPLREEDRTHIPAGSSDEDPHTSADNSNEDPHTAADEEYEIEGGEDTDDDIGDEDVEGDEGTDDDEEEGSSSDSALKDLVDIHCSKAVKELFSEEELEYFADFVINTLQPQAVNLLIESFPAFREAAQKGELGKNIGLEIDHSSTSTAVGMAMTGAFGRNYNYAYKVWINTYPVSKDLDTSSPTILRDGDEIVDLANTMVHEFLHIFMHDYTRTGMSGTTSPSEDYYEKDGKTPTAKAQAAMFPQWFIEGTASAVEHNWRNRTSEFSLLKMNQQNEYLDSYDAQTFLYRYVKGVAPTGELAEYNFDIECSGGSDRNGNTVDTLGNRYVTGYLATLYLCEMAAQHDPELGSSIQTRETGTTIYSGNLKEGLNSILKRLHEGETLDAIVKDISDGRYTGADDFGSKYIKGELEDGYYYGDKPSLDFTLTLLNYMKALDDSKRFENPVNGSILFEFFGDFNTPLDLNPSETITTDTYKVIDSADYVRSTVSENTAYETGGKSISGKPADADAAGADAAEVALANASSGDADAAEVASDEGAFDGRADTSGAYGAAAKEAIPSDETAAGEGASDETPADMASSDEAPGDVASSDEEALTMEAHSDESLDEEVSE